MNWYKKAYEPENVETSSEVENTVIIINDAISETHITQPSETLLHHVAHLIPEGWDRRASHVVLHEGAAQNRLDIGKEVVVTATGISIDGEVLSLLVRALDEETSEDIFSGHIVVAVNNRAKEESDPERWTSIREVIDEEGKNMSEFTVVGYLGELTSSGEVLFND